MPAKPKKPVKPQDALISLLKSPIYDELLERLEAAHPVNVSLPLGSTIEQRAMFQAKCETFQEVMKALRTFRFQAIQTNIESTYEKENSK